MKGYCNTNTYRNNIENFIELISSLVYRGLVLVLDGSVGRALARKAKGPGSGPGPG